MQRHQFHGAFHGVFLHDAQSITELPTVGRPGHPVFRGWHPRSIPVIVSAVSHDCSMSDIPVFRAMSVPADARLVIRGDPKASTDVMRRNAERFMRKFPDSGVYGLSGFFARSEAEIAALCSATALKRFPSILVYQREALQSYGILVLATFQLPHVTLAHSDLEQLISGLLCCPHDVAKNIYYRR